MAFLAFTEENVRRHLCLSKRTVEKYRARGAPGFRMTGGALFFDPEVVKAWRAENVGNPGPRPAAPQAPAEPIEEAGGGGLAAGAPLLDPELIAELKELDQAEERGAPLEAQLIRCKLLFNRFTAIALTWNDERLIEPADQKAFCDVVKTLNQLTAKITAMEAKLIEVKRRHGELIPIDDVRAMLRSLADDVIRGSEDLAGPVTSRLQSFFEEAAPGVLVDGDEMRRLVLEEIKRWRSELAERQKAGPAEAAA